MIPVSPVVHRRQFVELGGALLDLTYELMRDIG